MTDDHDRRTAALPQTVAGDRGATGQRPQARYPPVRRGRGDFEVAELTENLDLPHTTAHEYCRDLRKAGLLHRTGGKPAAYAPLEFDIHLSLEAVAAAVESEHRTVDYATERYGDDVVDAVIDVWERVEAGELTYREASGMLDMRHADFLRVASELDLLAR